MKWKVKAHGSTLRENPHHMSLAILVFITIISHCQSAPSNRDEVIFYEDTKHNGDRIFLTLGKGCYTMEKDWDNVISSVDPQGNCIMAFEKPDCRGRSVKLSEGLTGLDDLGRLQFDNLLTSISACSRSNDRRTSSSNDYRQGNNNELEIWRVGIEEHNRYRRLHGVSPIKGDRQLHDEAQEHADYLAKNNRFELSPGTKYGENLATSYEKDKLDAVREVIKRWYDKIEYFNFRNPDTNKDRPKSAQFSSMVWKSTTHMGIGVARNNQENKWVVVVFYDPAATRSKYRENVPPPLKQLYAQEPVLFHTAALSNYFNPRRQYE